MIKQFSSNLSFSYIQSNDRKLISIIENQDTVPNLISFVFSRNLLPFSRWKKNYYAFCRSNIIENGTFNALLPLVSVHSPWKM